MSKELVISASSHERRVAILEEGQLVEIYIEREKEFALVGSIYKGKVTRVLPGMQSAFVDIGLDGDAFLYVSDVFENLEDYDHGHDHAQAPGDTPLPAIAGGNVPSTIELLPGESLATSGGRGDAHHDETHADHASVDEPPQEEYRAAEFREREEAAAEAAAEQHQDSEVSDADERQPESNASAPQNFAPSYNPTRSYPPRGGSDRGTDRGGDRGGDRAGDRGRGRRGRWGRRRPGGSGGGGEHHHGQGGRNLPPSKYASPQGDRNSRGYDNRRPSDRVPSAPVDKAEDDIVLPGESLAKYRGRPVPTPVETMREQEPEERQPDFEPPTGRPAGGLPQSGPGIRRRFSGSLPHWVLADAESDAESTQSEEAAASASSEAAEAICAPVEEHPQEAIAALTTHNGAPSLDEEQLAALSANVVEAKHEETQARADADTLVGGAAFDEEEEETHEADEHPSALAKMPKTKPTANIRKPSTLPNPICTRNMIRSRNPRTSPITNPSMTPSSTPAMPLRSSSPAWNPNPTLPFPRRVKLPNPSSRKMWFFFPAKLALLATPTLHAKNLFVVIPRASAAILALDSKGRNAADGIVAATAAGVGALTVLAEEIVAVIVVVTAAQIAAVDASSAAAALAIATARIAGIRVDTLPCAVRNSFPKCSSRVRT